MESMRRIRIGKDKDSYVTIPLSSIVKVADMVQRGEYHQAARMLMDEGYAKTLTEAGFAVGWDENWR